jgi:hypothetical protein
MSYSGQVQFQTLTIVASAAVTTGYVAAVTLSRPCIVMHAKNGTNGDVLMGIDGSTAKWGFPPLSGAAYDIRTNAPQNDELMIPAGTTLYVKWNGSAPAAPTGNFYIELTQVKA